MKVNQYIIVFLLVLSAKSCQPSYDIQGIETGIANFQDSNQVLQQYNSQRFVYNYFSKFQFLPNIVFAINNIQSKNSNRPSFSIIVANKNITYTQFQLVNYKKWSRITINFIIISRQDFVIVNTKIDIINQLNLYNINVSSQNSHFLKTFNSQNSTTKYIGKVFLNGIIFNSPLQKLNQQYFGINTKFISINSNIIFIQVAGTSISKIKSIWISFIMYFALDKQIISYEGSISRTKLTGFSNQNIHHNIYRSQYKLFGVGGFQFKNQPLSMISNINEEFMATLYSSNLVPSLTVEYFILGKPYDKICDCTLSKFKYVNQDSCLQICPAGSFQYSQQNKAIYLCLQCNQKLNMKMNINKTKCECLEGYQFSLQILSCILYNSSFENAFKTSKQKSLLITPFISISPLPTSFNMKKVQKNTNQLKPNSSSNVAQENSQTVNSLKLSLLCNQSNTYFDGSVCHCKIGFVLNNATNRCELVQQIKSSQKQIVSIPFYLLKNEQITPICQNQNQILLSNGSCTCQTGYIRKGTLCIDQNQNQNSSNCGIGQVWNGYQCICILGFIRVSNNRCQQQPNPLISCSQNQINNGLGFCICKYEYYKINGSCISSKPCPLNSIRTSASICKCNLGFFNVSDQCLNCPQGQYWISNQKKCATMCGANAFYNQTRKQCQCIQNYAILSKGFCEYCSQTQRFIINNYCVSCLINQKYDQLTRKCICIQGYYLQKNGVCYSKCKETQIYDSKTQSCVCMSSLGRLNGICQICPQNYYPDSLTHICTLCKGNERYQEGKCICKDGFVRDQYGVCIKCTQIINYFLIDGKCATCPGNKIYNGTLCICPISTIAQGARKCIQQCKYDELLDNQGNCYACPINQIVSSNQCICMNNYRRNSNGICELQCQEGAFKYKGRCGVCPLNKVFSSLVNGCICRDGYYVNLNNQCQKLNLNIISCPKTTYFDTSSDCIDCPQSCQSCTNSSYCLKCSDTYLNIDGKCLKPKCGDGIITSNIEECDDQNILNNDGCSSMCKVQSNFKCQGTPSLCKLIYNIQLPFKTCGNGFIEQKQQCDDQNLRNGDGCSSQCIIQRSFSCSGQPSVCSYNSSYHVCSNGFVQVTQSCDDLNFINGDGCNQNCSVQAFFNCTGQPSICVKNIQNTLKQYNDIKLNTNNIFIVLQTSQKINFSSQSQMQTFIKTSFSNNQKPATYCLQRQFPDLDLFDCLLIYSSGLPNKAFQIQFIYNYRNKIGKLTVNIDPLNIQIQRTKNLRGK